MEINEFDNLISLADAAKKWHLDESTIRKAISSGKLVENIDAKKFGKQWVIKKNSMIHEYGPLNAKIDMPQYSDLKRADVLFFTSQCFLKYIQKYKLDNKEAVRRFSKYNIWEYIYACYDYLHLGNINDAVKDIAARIKRGVVFD